jgi:hypothetical protein
VLIKQQNAIAELINENIEQEEVINLLMRENGIGEI